MMTARDEAARYTPTIERVRDSYSWALSWDAGDHEDRPDLAKLQVDQRAEFDRALAAHDAQVKAEALREAADTLAGDPAARLWELWDAERGEYSTPVDWLRSEADRIEKGSDLCDDCCCWPEDLLDYPGDEAWEGTDDRVRRHDKHPDEESS